MRRRSSPDISPSRSARSSYSISSSTPIEPVEVEAFDEADLLGLGQLLEEVGEALVVHRRGELAALGERQVAHDLGDLRRVHVAQAGRLGGDRR